MKTCTTVWIVGAAFGAMAAGCSDGDGTGGAGGDGASGAGGPTSASATSTVASTVASTSSGAGGEGGTAPGPDFFAATVHGALFTADMAQAKTTHDAIAAGGQQQAEAAGDFAHDVLLGTTLLGTPENEFRAVDRWHSVAGMTGFYSDPAVQEAFAQLFSGPPSIEFFGHQPTWYGWGDLDAADTADPHYFAIVRAHLKSADATQNHQTHDAIASGGEGQAAALGDLGHVVFLGLEDEREFLAVDLWDNPDGPVTLYTNPDFQAAFAQLFDSVDVRIYASTDWHQW